MSNSFHIDGIKAFTENNYEKAIALFLQSIEQYPEEVESHFYLAKSYFYNDEKDQAIASIKKFIEVSNDKAKIANAYNLLGQCYEAKNSDAEALAYYEQAVKTDPSCAEAWNSRGLLCLKTAKEELEKDVEAIHRLFTEAKSFIDQALNICSSFPLFLQGIALWYEQYTDILEVCIENEIEARNAIKGHFIIAMDYYQKALSACREDDSALRNIIFVNLTECKAQYGHCFYRNKEYKAARKIYLETLERDPDHLGVITQIGMTYSKQECFPEARKYFFSILEKTLEEKEIADASLNIAYTYRLEKNLEEAEKALKRAEELAPDDTYVVAERKELMQAKSAAALISAPQILLANSNPVSQPNLNHESLNFQYN